MKIKALFLCLLITATFINPAFAEDEERNVATFSEISLRIPGKLHLEQGKSQSVEIVAKSAILDDIITEVKGRKLIIRFPGKNYFKKSFDPGKVEIFITVPEIDALGISGSGDIIAEDEIESRIIDLAVSGSGDIFLDKLNANRVKASISGSGDINIKDGNKAEELTVSMSGSGSVKAGNFEAENITVRIAGSGNCSVKSNGNIKARIAGSGNVNYKGNPSIDSSIAGSGKVNKM